MQGDPTRHRQPRKTQSLAQATARITDLQEGQTTNRTQRTRARMK